MGVCCIDTVSVSDLPPVVDPSRMLDVGIVHGLKNLDFMGKELFMSFLESGVEQLQVPYKSRPPTSL
jgi:hypothetical protein